jgi:uncharacterized NAD(P)/FAD-binding protein YdhS
MSAPPRVSRVVVVGGGASGVLLGIHLLDGTRGGICVTIVERHADLGAGIAYATNNPHHLLNVRASNMSAFSDDPDHFAHWLCDRPGLVPEAPYGPDSFAARHLYRDYLASLLAPLLSAGRLHRVHAAAVAVREMADSVEIECQDGTRLGGDVAVIATDNEGPSLPPEPWRFDGWNDHAPHAFAPDASLAVIGTGLTMADRVLSLLHSGHVGPITAVSRPGLSPQADDIDTVSALSADEIPFGKGLSELIAWMRKQVEERERTGGGWRGFVDGLRPHTQTLWQRLPEVERRRFLRHARPFWDVHRHRIAPAAARHLEAAGERGQLRIVAAHVVAFTPRDTGVDVHLARRHDGAREIVHADAVFECRGRTPDITQSENPLLREMLRSGVARPDALELGLSVTEGCAVVNEAGCASRRLYALGPVTSGTFWEMLPFPIFANRRCNSPNICERERQSSYGPALMRTRGLDLRWLRCAWPVKAPSVRGSGTIRTGTGAAPSAR